MKLRGKLQWKSKADTAIETELEAHTVAANEVKIPPERPSWKLIWKLQRNLKPDTTIET